MSINTTTNMHWSHTSSACKNRAFPLVYEENSIQKQHLSKYSALSAQLLSELEEMALYTVEGQTLVIYHVLRVCFSLSCCALDILMDMLSVLYYTIFPSSHTFPPSSTIFPYCPCPYIPRNFTCYCSLLPTSLMIECQKVEVRWVKNRELFH